MFHTLYQEYTEEELNSLTLLHHQHHPTLATIQNTPLHSNNNNTHNCNKFPLMSHSVSPITSSQWSQKGQNSHQLTDIHFTVTHSRFFDKNVLLRTRQCTATRETL